MVSIVQPPNSIKLSDEILTVAVEKTIFDANSNPSPINPFAEKYTASTSEETKDEIAGTASFEHPRLRAQSLKDEALTETIIPSPEKRPDLSQSQFVDILQSSQYPLAQGSK